MSIARTPIFPTSQQAGQAQPNRNAGGQRAFFAAAMGAPAATADMPGPAPATPRIPVDLPAEPPAKILRPGSLLDIWV
ncbi:MULTISPECIES: hypothetical protein [Phenylobacterium]|uniref:Uncharacterized protein n=1 Tax=Phenylobacterium koreense TaxID=266125 RepID=A0ABV2EH98_9CAUL